MKLLKYFLIFFFILAIPSLVNCKGKNGLEEKSNAGKTIKSSKSALKVASELIEAGMNGDFKKLAELFCKHHKGPYTTYEDVVNLDLGPLGHIEKLMREENGEIDPKNFKLVVARTRDSGKLGFQCFFVLKTPANYKIYLYEKHTDRIYRHYLFPYPQKKEGQLYFLLEFYLFNYNKFPNSFIQKRFEEILKDLNEDEREQVIDMFSHSYPDYAMSAIKSGVLKGEVAMFFFHKETQKGVMRDIEGISIAIADFRSDEGFHHLSVPKQQGTYDENSAIYKSLAPFYIKKLPIKDPWGNKYRIYTGTYCNEKYGITGCNSDDFIVVSYGSDGKEENWKFDSGNPKAGLTVMKSIDDFAIDFVMWNGSWIRGLRR